MRLSYDITQILHVRTYVGTPTYPSVWMPEKSVDRPLPPLPRHHHPPALRSLSLPPPRGPLFLLHGLRSFRPLFVPPPSDGRTGGGWASGGGRRVAFQPSVLPSFLRITMSRKERAPLAVLLMAFGGVSAGDAGVEGGIRERETELVLDMIHACS